MHALLSIVNLTLNLTTNLILTITLTVTNIKLKGRTPSSTRNCVFRHTILEQSSSDGLRNRV